MDIRPSIVASGRYDQDGGVGDIWVFELERVCEALDLRPSEVRALNAWEDHGRYQSNALLEALGFEGDGAYYSGPGRGFSRGFTVRFQRSRIVVRHACQLDI